MSKKFDAMLQVRLEPDIYKRIKKRAKSQPIPVTIRNMTNHLLSQALEKIEPQKP